MANITNLQDEKPSYIENAEKAIKDLLEEVKNNPARAVSLAPIIKALLSIPGISSNIISEAERTINEVMQKMGMGIAMNGYSSNDLSSEHKKLIADFYISMAKFEQSAKSYAELLEEAKKKEDEFKNLLMNTIEANPKSEAADNARIKLKDNIVGRLSIANDLEAKSKECDEHYEKMQVATKEIENDKSLSQEQKDILLDQAKAELISAQAKLAGLNSQNQALGKQLVADIEKAVLDKAAVSKSSSMAEYKQIISNGISEEQKKEIAIFVKDCQGMPKDLIIEKYENLEGKITSMQALKVEELGKIGKPEWAEKVEKGGGEVESTGEKVRPIKLSHAQMLQQRKEKEMNQNNGKSR
ncbi:MAG: hypothetical protein K0R73_1014 [Candidatus Midichloriaceae bacterium]|jgi:hypothetical protein|nr:hypothetical protein [Candidatus Midichloriaceae bacterium]